MITRVKTFWQPLTLELGPTGTYTNVVLPPAPAGEAAPATPTCNLDEEVNAWLTRMDVRPVYVSPPAIQVTGRDQQGRLHLTISVSLLYLSQEEVSGEPAADSKFESGGLGGLVRTLQSQIDQHIPGAKLDEVVRVIKSDDAAKLGIDPATIGKRIPVSSRGTWIDPSDRRGPEPGGDSGGQLPLAPGGNP